MFRRFAYSLGGVLPHHLTPLVRALYSASLLQNLALAMLLLFEPIYLWQLGYGVREILLFFLAVYVTYFATMPLGAKFACRFGYERSMVLASFIQVAYFTCLYLVVRSPWFLVPTVLLYALQKTFYWPAYHADFARYSDGAEEGRELSALSVASSLVYVVGPLLAGWILVVGSWAWLFGFGCLLLLLSNWPLVRTPEVFTPRVFPYAEAYRRLFSRVNRRLLLGYMGFGEELIVLTLWPVFMAVVVVNYVEIGAVVAAATLVMAVATLYVGKLTDERNKEGILRYSTVLYALGWLVRTAVATPWGVFLADAWSRLTKSVVSVPLTAITYERAKSRSIMDTVVSFEMSLVVGKVVAAVVLLGVLAVTPEAMMWQAAWLVAAAMTFLYTLL